MSFIRRNKKRQRERFAQAYGSPERAQWVTTQPCVVPGCRTQPCQNVHIQVAGMGLKAASTFIVPACLLHHDLLDNQLGRRKFEALYHVDLAAEAIDLELRWRQHVARQPEASF